MSIVRTLASVKYGESDRAAALKTSSHNQSPAARMLRAVAEEEGRGRSRHRASYCEQRSAVVTRRMQGPRRARRQPQAGVLQ